MNLKELSMDLSQIRPKESTFKLRFAGEKVFTMNPISLGDEIWLEGTYGDRIGEVFENVNTKEISRIVFRLLKVEDKSFFKKQKVDLVNEEGEESEIEIGGVALLQSLISGWEEKVVILNALLENIGLSRPEVDDSKEEIGDKKKEKN